MVFICLFETEFWVSQADLKLSVYLTLSFCLRLSSVGVWSTTPDMAGGFGKGLQVFVCSSLSRESVWCQSQLFGCTPLGGGDVSNLIRFPNS